MARHRILVVDDEDNLRDVLVEVLKRDRHEVDSAADGAERLRRAEGRRYDLVITDLRMPGLEGPALYEGVRRRYPDDPPRVIFMSANTGIEEYASFLLETGEPALEKPFNLADMRQVVLQVLTQKRRGGRVDGSAGRC
ncbi:MAG: response regulator [Candidatus Rokuibacteriota bacterium]